MAKTTTKKADSDDTPIVFDINLSDTTLGGMVKRRAAEASGHWEKEYSLKKVRENNKGLYNSEDVQKKLRDERYEEVFSDNRHFINIRTVLPFITSQMTQPEITPANSDSLSLQFAQDYEQVLVEVAEEAYVRDKVKLSLQDLLMGQRVGVGKWVAEPDNNKLRYEHIDPSSVIIGKRAALHEEPDFIQHTQERTVGDLIRQFPDKQPEIFKLFGIDKGVPSQLERVEKITENWIWIEEDDSKKLAVVFMAGSDLVLGKMSDPNWIDNGSNVAQEHMMPFVFFNFLNDGSGYIDNTSFIEMAEFTQKQYNKRGDTISQNAAYAGIGVPVFGKGAVKEETAAKVEFSPVQRILLDTEDVGKSFTTWTAGELQSFVVEDKNDLKNSIADVYGSNSIQQGATPDNPNDNLGQDVLLRNQAEGRQQELIDCIDNGMSRSYEIESQMIYRYFDDEQYYNFIGDDGEFEHIVISQSKIAKNIGIKIKIKSGSSLPVDRSQKMAQAIELAKMDKIGTLRLFKELGLKDPEQAYKEYLREHLLPFGELGEMDKEIFSREADEDLQLVVAGKMPDDREDIDQEYLTHLQEYLLSQKYEQLPKAAQSRVSQYVANIIAQAERKVLKMQMMQPILPPSSGQLPPIRAKISLSSKDLEPDVRAQIVQNAGYQPSQMLQSEMAAGLVDPPTERMQMLPLDPAEAAPTSGQPAAPQTKLGQAAQVQQALQPPQPQQLPSSPPPIHIHTHPK